MSFVIEDEVAVSHRGSGAASPRGEPLDPHSDLALAMRLGCRFVLIVLVVLIVLISFVLFCFVSLFVFIAGGAYCHAWP